MVGGFKNYRFFGLGWRRLGQLRLRTWSNSHLPGYELPFYTLINAFTNLSLANLGFENLSQVGVQMMLSRTAGDICTRCKKHTLTQHLQDQYKLDESSLTRTNR